MRAVGHGSARASDSGVRGPLRAVDHGDEPARTPDLGERGPSRVVGYALLLGDPPRLYQGDFRSHSDAHDGDAPQRKLPQVEVEAEEDDPGAKIVRGMERAAAKKFAERVAEKRQKTKEEK